MISREPMTVKDMGRAKAILKEHGIKGSPLSFSEDAESYRIGYAVITGDTYLGTFPKSTPLDIKEYRHSSIGV